MSNPALMIIPMLIFSIISGSIDLSFFIKSNKINTPDLESTCSCPVNDIDCFLCAKVENLVKNLSTQQGFFLGATILSFLSFIPICLNSTVVCVIKISMKYTVLLFSLTSENINNCNLTNDVPTCMEAISLNDDMNNKFKGLFWASFSFNLLNLLSFCSFISLVKK